MASLRGTGTNVLLLLSVQNCIGMLIRGSQEVPVNSTIFLGKFCFSFNPSDDWTHDRSIPDGVAASGRLELDLDISSGNLGRQSLSVLLFDDEAHSFPGPSGQWDALSCKERMKHAKDVIPVRASQRKLSISVREKLRPRWWYVALADCSGLAGGVISVEYEMRAQNTLYRGWQVEFSSDRRWALPVLLVMCVFYLGLSAVQQRVNLALAALSADCAGSKAAHPFARILLAGVVLELTACSLEALYNGLYAVDGYGVPALHVLSLLLSSCSNFVLASLLLLVSQGKCVSYRMVAADGHRMLKLLGPFFVACFLLELWGDFAASRTYSTDYAYATKCGFLIILVDLGLFTTYVQNTRKTMSLEGGRAHTLFYRTWGVVYSSWFLALPFSALLSKVILAPYIWYIVSLCIMKCITALVYLALVVALWPENSRTSFKFVVSPPEWMMETCPSPPSRSEEVVWPSDTPLPKPQWITRPADLPNLLGKAYYAMDAEKPMRSQR